MENRDKLTAYVEERSKDQNEIFYDTFLEEFKRLLMKKVKKSAG